ncbi:hypothetical protein LCGC14_1585080 [marine sediment metagenome]|uniref:Translation initiation factor 3 N-terminal domain-containing protein n=1 Tax=marine sediment metagenome TaxID=412755 RepID=A0A0F9KWB6_9ZZZZ
MSRTNCLARVVLINEEGQSQGEMSLSEATRVADEEGLDLVEVNRRDNLSVCRIMDRGKWQYDKKKKAKKKLHDKSHRGVKEIKFRVGIDTHDQNTKVNHIKKFLQKGYSVKLAIQLRGREKATPSLGHAKLKEIVQSISELARCDEVKQAALGKTMNIHIMVHPLKLKKKVENGKEETSNNDDLNHRP